MTQTDTSVESTPPKPILLADYRVPDFLIDTVALRFALHDGETIVHADLAMRRNATSDRPDAPLVLDGQQLELREVTLDGIRLDPGRYTVDADHLTIPDLPDAFQLTTEVRIEPEKNTALEGLYRSGPFYCTQCEAEGFRRITYYLDRPDVLARFTTTIEGDKAQHPVLLSNGNPIDRGDLDGGRHYVTWEDPHKKPCYLFALVAGDLVHIEDHHVTSEGRDVTLQIYTTPANIDKCDHAMASLKHSMRWDEETYGLACDLDYYMIVVTDDFNMGAMENKGLNIFNSKYVLARPDTATDGDYLAIEGVIAHEYFHNWTGNRVTCRDWFQLSLKEGLTVFRDQRFSGDRNSRAIQRINDVRTLRTVQFPEDRGPMAHPIRPPSVIEINNFYTVTVYEKGAEVVRMYETLLGEEGFRRGMDLYFERHDGQAVTCDDFRQAMADANGRDLSQFAHWYSQSGTPTVAVRAEHDPAAGTYTLHVSQSCPPSKTLPNDQPFHIPLAVGLLDAEGRDLPLQLAGDPTPPTTTRVLELKEREQSFTFQNVPETPRPSLLRNFSAPVMLEHEASPEDLAFLMAHDSDPFCRWDASQQLMLGHLADLIADYQAGRPMTLPADVAEAFATTLSRRNEDLALTAELLILPGESFLGDQMDVVDVEAVHEARKFARAELARTLQHELLATYRECTSDGEYSLAPTEVARRAMQNISLGYLMALGTDEAYELCRDQYAAARNMTEVVAALVSLCHYAVPGHEAALAAFYDKWQDDALVIDKWLSIQATAPVPGTLATVQRLMDHEAFQMTNPNKVRSLIGAFCGQNRINFHDRDGSGYAFLVDQVLALNAINPQIAARLAGILNPWRRYDPTRQDLMRTQLERMVAHDGLSRDVYEIASKALA